MSAHLLFVGGEDHNLRIPFILALRAKKYRVSAAAGGDPAPFARAGIEHRRFHFNRFTDPHSDWRALHALQSLLEDVDADIAHCFNTKLGLLVPFAARAIRRTRIVHTINGRGWLYSSRSVGALALRAGYGPLQRLAALSTSATVFEHHGDKAFFVRNHLLGKGEATVIPAAGIAVDGFELARARGASSQQLRHELGLKELWVRLLLWTEALQRGAESHMLGFGPGPHLAIPFSILYGRRTSDEPVDLQHPKPELAPNVEAHNTTLEFFVQGGILAGGAFLSLCAVALWRAWQAGIHGLTSLLLATGAFGSFHVVSRHPMVWFIISLALLAPRNGRPKPVADRTAQLPRLGVGYAAIEPSQTLA